MIATTSDETVLLTSPDRTEALDVLPEQLDDQNIVGFRNSDSRARPFKLMRSQIMRQREERGLKVIGITSAAPNVGKTFVASNLAAALSRIADHDVYLVDLDLHRPAVATRFSFEPEGLGVHDFLTGEEPGLRNIARRINDERLVVVPGYRRDIATGELLTSANGGRLFDGLRALPDSAIVLVDMPPLFADDDAVIIGQHLDGFILVVEDGKSTRKQALETIRLLSPTPFVGAVLNRYRSQ
ncbi:MAG TPA: CpsD/CapB family tyrosine-protein kinase, partial [Sphingomonas sp.]|nr:CpsD/CapB family tyrosine-protein kinase [Sphingomonas sp.]